MSICDACMKKPIHPDKKCCFNCVRGDADCGVWHHCGEDCPAWEGKVKTNTDRIRAMSDDDLARILYDRPWCHHHCEHTGEDECLDCIARYLQRPAKEVDK